MAEVMLVSFDFVGGPKDGESVADRLDSATLGSAAAYYYASGGGTPGALVWCWTEYLVESIDTLSESALLDLHVNGSPLRDHIYEVFDRSQSHFDLRIRARHVGAIPARGRPQAADGRGAFLDVQQIGTSLFSSNLAQLHSEDEETLP